MTNVRFSNDHSRVITTGGADQSIFQWRFLPEGFRDNQAIPDEAAGYGDSDDEQSDSDVSEVGELDSDVENVMFIFIIVLFLEKIKFNLVDLSTWLKNHYIVLILSQWHIG